MDISKEGSIDTSYGWVTAQRVVFYRTLTHCKRKVLGMIVYGLYEIRRGAKILLWELHPKNPLGMVVLCVVVTFTLNRHYILQKNGKKKGYKPEFWVKLMRCSRKYKEWCHAADMMEKAVPKVSNDENLYDVELVSNKLLELQHRRESGSIREMMFWLRADLVRNLGNMCNPDLHRGRIHVPGPIAEYISELVTQLNLVCLSNPEDITLDEKSSFIREARHAFGRSALVLSGGASLGSFHIGVVETLIEHRLLPRIIAGSSVGSIVSAVMCTRSTAEIDEFFRNPVRFFNYMGGLFAILKRIRTCGAVQDIRELQVVLRHLTFNMTFEEAYAATGRILGVTVCSLRKHEPPRLLNYLTSPHVVIWSAVSASCAFPFLFEAQELMAKNRDGFIVPYHPPFHLGPEEGVPPPTTDRRWRDGSLQADLPIDSLKELFNVNHFIVSQANPHIAPLLRLKEYLSCHGGNYGAMLANLAEMELKHRCTQMKKLGFSIGELFAQHWEGDVTIVMSATAMQYLKIIQNPTESDIRKAVDQGRRSTFEKLSAIKANCGIELAIDECVNKLKHWKRIRRSSNKAQGTEDSKVGETRRIPSWNCLSREPSTDSLAEETFDANQNSFDDSESDSECDGGVQNSWTRNGGPLMRTVSADEFVEFLECLGNSLLDDDFADFRIESSSKGESCSNEEEAEAEAEGNGEVGGGVNCSKEGQGQGEIEVEVEGEEDDAAELNKRVNSSSSIVVTAEDILETQIVENTLVLNVKKKNVPTTVEEPNKEEKEDHHQQDDQKSDDSAEYMQLECSDGDLDATTTASEGGSEVEFIEEDDSSNPNPPNPKQQQ